MIFCNEIFFANNEKFAIVKDNLMERTLVRDLASAVGSEVMLQGRVLNMRKLGSISFIILQDYSGIVQTVWDSEVSIKTGDAISLLGLVKEEKRSKTGVEIQARELISSVSITEDLPIDLSKNALNLQLTTLLDHRPLSLRHPSVQAIFRLYDMLLESYEREMRRRSFIEIKTPKLLETASEGGSNFFKIQYFDKDAFLAQSPQFYKQIMVGVFERVFEIGSVFRAEPHFTTRHVNEYISLDGEMGFIKDYRDITRMLSDVLRDVFGTIADQGKEYLALYGAEAPLVPDEIPHVKLSEMKEILKKGYDHEIPETTDIDPEGERLACRYAKEKFNSDFIFITHYPWSDRPFYTMPSTENEKETYGFDLLFRGVELVTGSQRIHQHDELLANMKKKGVSPHGMEFYLDTFKYAMPPHGGWGMGSERLIQQLLGLSSIKEAVLFPRDVKRLSP